MHKIKICVLGTRGFPGVQGGVEKHCEELYSRLAALGCGTLVFTRTPYILRERRIKGWRGVNFIHLWCPRVKRLEAIIHTLLGVIFARFKSADILHIHAIGPSLLIPLAKIFGLKVVMTHHGPDYERKKWGLFTRLVLRTGEFFGVSFADRIIVISREIERNFEKRDRISYKTVYIPNGVNLPQITPAAETLESFALKPQEYAFIACRFVPEKGLHDLIEAYRRIQNPEFKLVIAGDADHHTDYSRKLKKQAEEAGAILTGFISGKPLEELYSNAGLFVLPSYHEGLSIALFEALSYGLPVLVSDIPQNKEVLLPEYRYFKVGDVGQLAKKLEELMKKGITEEEKSRQREILAKEYDWDEIARRTMFVYSSVDKIPLAQGQSSVV